MRLKTRSATRLSLVLLCSLMSSAGHCWDGMAEQGSGGNTAEKSWSTWKVEIWEEKPRTTGNISIDRYEEQDLRRCQAARRDLEKKGKWRSSFISCPSEGKN